MISTSAAYFSAPKYQNEHALLVALLGGLLLMVVVTRQGLVHGSHGDIRALWMCLRCTVAGTEKVREHLMPSGLARMGCMGPRARTRHGRECMGRAFRHHARHVATQLRTPMPMPVASGRSAKQLFGAASPQPGRNAKCWSVAQRCCEVIRWARGGRRCSWWN